VCRVAYAGEETYLAVLGGDALRLEWSGPVVEDDEHGVVAQVPLALDLLAVLLRIRQHRAHVEHDLVTERSPSDKAGEHLIARQQAVKPKKEELTYLSHVVNIECVPVWFFSVSRPAAYCFHP
jgi:hypothetical protein